MNRALILVVEDEEFLAQALKDNLEASGCIVDVATNGEVAMDHFRKTPPHLVLLDLLMPKSDGFHVLQEIRKNPEWKAIPIIVLSNLGGDDEIKRALELGADDYFVKAQHPIEDVISRAMEYLRGAIKTKGKNMNG